MLMVWLATITYHRPHQSLAYLAPAEYVEQNLPKSVAQCHPCGQPAQAIDFCYWFEYYGNRVGPNLRRPFSDEADEGLIRL
jgi:hypothetical protein